MSLWQRAEGGDGAEEDDLEVLLDQMEPKWENRDTILFVIDCSERMLHVSDKVILSFRKEQFGQLSNAPRMPCKIRLSAAKTILLAFFVTMLV